MITDGTLRAVAGLVGAWWVLAAGAAPITVVQTGPSSNRVNMLFLGDGYTSDLLETTYVTHINAMVDHFFHQGENPYPRYEKFFNVYRINVTSAQTGADVPPLGIFRNTALDASYYWDGATERLMYVNEAKANTALTSGLSGSGITPHLKLLTVNDARYGGGGGTYAVYAGGSSSATEIALHEQGHSFSALADEYYTAGTTYTGGEPGAVNITKDPTGTKWSRWLGYNDPDTGPVGAYPGAGYYQYGLYRPSNVSKMRSLGVPFDPVAREKIILDLYKIVRPLDGYLSNASTLVDPSAVWVDLVDPTVQAVEWRVNGAVVAGAGEALSLAGYGNGTYTVTARAYDTDPYGWVRADSSSMQQTVTWTVRLTPEPGAGVVLIAVGMATLSARRRRG